MESPRKHCILIVDDDSAVQVSLALLLKQAGYATVCSDDPAQALAAQGFVAQAAIDNAAARQVSQALIQQMQQQHDISDLNLIKPGLGEATRVLLRRVPRLVILRDPNAPAVAHLRVLAAEKSVPVKIQPDLPYQAVSLISSAKDS